ncbi:MAG: carboxypeptidase-like regulatory domain-containing protein [Acidobacteriota bacterium]|nr:carboxypeptidase-like regulatory domain-containing protein [Blastocatellia bacterium]MDW8238893.1 carboxypeptidase-like regulatory domain-containing protein [Acidobacteriota bacterium]
MNMKGLAKRFTYVVVTVWMSCLSQAVFAQATSGTITGTVTDIQGAVVPEAEVVVINQATGFQYRTKSNDDGFFAVTALPVGVYSVQASAAGFKQIVMRDIKLDVGGSIKLTVVLDVGQMTEVVIIEGGGEVLINKSSPTINSTITGRQITELPFVSRDALDLVLTLPGTATPGTPRTSSINGLPKGAIDITFDGINVQDNYLRSSDGFFTIVRPRIDAVEEVSVTTSNAGADAAGEGAVKIKFVTKSGTNEWHGGGWWYHRNTALNSNYFFNNQARLPRQIIVLNQFGGKIGGPVIKNRFFFFFAQDEFRLPQSSFVRRNILTAEARRGLFTYARTDRPGQTNAVNLFDLAGRNGFPSTADPQITALLEQIDQARGSVAVRKLDLIRDEIGFNSRTYDRRSFSSLRLDLNITSNHRWEGTYHYQYFNNQGSPVIPGFTQRSGQVSNRYLISTALRSTLAANKVNEFRFGFQAAPVAFNPGVGLETFTSGFVVNFPSFLTSPFQFPTAGRNTPYYQWADQFTWTKGAHNLNFGGNFSWIRSKVVDYDPFGLGSAIPDISFGVLPTDPADAMFNTDNFPGISTANELPRARALYAFLTGRISGVTGSVYVNERTRKYEQFIPLVQKTEHVEYGFYAQDSWRATQELTLNYGLRWEYQGAPRNTNNIYSTPGFEGLWGISGVGNLFRPGVLTGRPTVYHLVGDQPVYARDLDNLAPSLGFAWSPQSQHWLMRKLFGTGGASAIRGGFSISYTREGLTILNDFMIGPNPGPYAFGELVPDVHFTPGSLLLRNGVPPLSRQPREFQFPIAQADFTYGGVAPNAFIPNLKTPYVQQWSFGLQREIMRDTVLEIRYVGNRGVKLYRQFDLNEVNIFENGFLQEFINAQNNLRISRAANRGALFSNQGLPGQVRLPILEAAFGTTNPRAPLFRNTTFVNYLDTGQAGAFAQSLAFSAAFFPRLVAAGYPPNFFVVNPETTAGNYVLDNGGASSYNALQIELRRRLSKGLLVQGNYTFSKSLTNFAVVDAVTFQNYITIRNPDLNKGLSPFDITHALKVNWIYELPFGPGRLWNTSSSMLNKIIGGWQTDGIVRIQSGPPFRLTSGRLTYNGSATPLSTTVVLKNITRNQLQKMLKIRKLPNGRVFFFPPELIGSDGRANPEFIDSPTTPGELGAFFFLHGPPFYRADLSVLKKTPLTEKLNLEFRAEFLNAFNTVNFFFPVSAASQARNHSINSVTFGEVFEAYRDFGTTNDPGGRIIQFVFRINF